MGVAILWGVGLVLGVLATGHLPTHWQQLASFPIAATDALVCWYFVCRKHGRSLMSGFGLQRPDKTVLLRSTLIGVGCGLVGCAVLSAFSTGKSAVAEWCSTMAGRVVFTIMALTLPITEEMYYRGFIFPVLYRKWGNTLSVIVITAWFAAAHAFQVAGDWVAFPVIVGMGLILTLQRLRTGGLIASTLTHLVYNTVTVTWSWLA